MGLSRDRLRDAQPQLHSSLERSWEIAFNEWLPALGAQADSFNSFPHLRNLEIHLDKLLEASESLPTGSGAGLLGPVELYVVLSAILFHDIGRIRTKKGHGAASADIIRDQHAALGIQSEEMANTIAKICAFHDVSAKQAADEIAKLSTVVVDPYGPIRERECGALLTLVDHLDGAFTRVLPEYVKSLSRIEPIGAFRRAVRGVEVDLEGHLVKVVLGEHIWDGDVDEADIRLLVNADRFPSRGEYGKRPKETARGKPPLIDAVLDSSKGPVFDRAEWALARQEVFIERKSRKPTDPHPCGNLNGLPVVHRNPVSPGGGSSDSSSPWKHERLLAVLMGNTRENSEALLSIRDILNAMGMPVRQWLLEYQEHLFNDRGEETCEPLFYKDYLVKVAEGMWKLSTEIFSQNEFSYQTLAGELREPDVNRIARAVRRLSILTRDDGPNKGMRRWLGASALWVGQSSWKWWANPSNVDPTRCEFAHLVDVVGRVRELREPSGEDQDEKT